MAAKKDARRLFVHPEVDAAIRGHLPVVALESAVITAGLPADRALDAARTAQRVVREAGAVPATVGVIAGALHLGLDDTSLERLAAEGAGHKASVRDLPVAMACGRTAGTTVSATLRACGLAPAGPVRVMATGGIGGVHRGWARHLDVSADLAQLAQAPVCVVAGGVKTVLDVAATLELLEALGVVVLAWGTDEMPQFYCRPAMPAPQRVDDLEAVAAICRTHWEVLGGRAAVLLANPVPAAQALDAAEIDRALDAAGAGGPGGRRTPDLLAAVAGHTGGRAVNANLALLAANADLAGRLAAQLPGGTGR